MIGHAQAEGNRTGGFDETAAWGGFFSPPKATWCDHCGRRRSAADGRCGNCDSWWASPLLQIGGPLTLGVVLLLALLVQTQTASMPSVSTTFPAAAAGAPVLSAPPTPLRGITTPLAPPFFSPLVNPPAAPLPPPPPRTIRFAASPLLPDTEMLRWAQHERLRQMCARADALVAADDAAGYRGIGPTQTAWRFTGNARRMPMAADPVF